MKWLGYLGATIVVLLIAVFVFIKINVGAVNTPLGESSAQGESLLSNLEVPKGFSVGIYAEVENARVLRFGPGGRLLVANPNLDRITILDADQNDDGAADGSRLLIEGLNGPNGIDFYEDWLYVAETDAIGRVKYDAEKGEIVGDYERIVTGLPAGENHWKKTLRFGPDNMMYVAMGSSCNVCIEADERRAALVRYNPDGTDEQIFALGLRNSAGFDWSPIDGQIYATDNGRDLLGDDYPPCELNMVVEGGHYGWPFANGAKEPDPDFGEGNEAIIESSIAPVFDFEAHNAPLGIEFVRDNNFPADYSGAAIVALHGSWNRSEKDGYKAVSLHWNEDGSVVARDFLSGLLKDDTAIGRPAEVTQGPDGAFYISDDYANVVYRVAYGEAARAKHVAQVEVAKFSAKETLGALSAEQVSGANTAGEALYNRYQCVSCHSDNGGGLKKLEKLGEKYDQSTLTAYFRRPIAPMPVFPLSDQEREDLAIYLIGRYPGS